MVIALAGRRIDAPGAEVTRFPLNNIDAVKEKLRKLFITFTTKGIGLFRPVVRIYWLYRLRENQEFAEVWCSSLSPGYSNLNL